MVRRVMVSALVGFVLVLSGCGGGTDPQSQSDGQSGLSQSATVTIPDTAVGKQITWLLGVLESEEALSVEDLESRLAPSFIEAMPAADVADLLNKQIRPAAPFVIAAYVGNDLDAEVTLAGRIGDPFIISMAIDQNGLINGLFLKPVVTHTQATSIEEVEERLRSLPLTVHALVRLEKPNQDPVDVISINPEKSAPLASAFKLYVLLAVANAVEAGDLSWEETVTVTDEVRSLPSGRLQDADTGTELSIVETAKRMIAESDNTATDMLISRLGRETVEQAVVAAGHHDPGLLRPFPTTKEFFEIGWGSDRGLAQRWKDSSEEDRRAILDELTGKPLTITAENFSGQTRWVDGVDWFASSEDIATIHKALWETKSPELEEILSVNPGIGMNFDSTVWSRINFKGGSSAGVLTGSWRAESVDGSILTVVMLAADEDPKVITANELEIFGLEEDLFRLVPEGK